MSKQKVDVKTIPFLRFVIDVILVCNLVYFGLFIIDRYLTSLSVLVSTPVIAKFISIYNPFYGSIVGLACVIFLKMIGIVRDYANTTLILMILSLLLSYVFRW